MVTITCRRYSNLFQFLDQFYMYNLYIKFHFQSFKTILRKQVLSFLRSIIDQWNILKQSPVPRVVNEWGCRLGSSDHTIPSGTSTLAEVGFHGLSLFLKAWKRIFQFFIQGFTSSGFLSETS